MLVKKKLEKKLWAIANELRGNMDPNEYKNYILGFIFYKYLSEKIEKFVNETLEFNKVSFSNVWKNVESREKIKKNCLKKLGYFLKPDYLFQNIVNKAINGEFIVDKLENGLKYIEHSSIGYSSEKVFIHVFNDIDLQSIKLGRTNEAKNTLISNVIKHLSEINFDIEDGDILGDAYEYLIAQFASNAGKKSGEFYTPQQISKILAKIVTLNKKIIKSVYDPTCGSGSLLLRVSKEAIVSKFYGQELNQTTYNLAVMNMILHNIKPETFHIEQGNTLEDDRYKEKKFEAIVANPPFSANWTAGSNFLKDKRFSEVGKLAPKTKADYAFVLHMLDHLEENGVMATVLPHGVLFRGAAEGVIREHLIKNKNYLDTIIGLPTNIFYGTPIPTVILVFKKFREHENNILFIDASNNFEKVKTQNILREEDIKKILKTFSERKDIEKYSRVISLDEIIKNNYNLNITRYIDTFEEEENINLKEIVDELAILRKEIIEVDKEIKNYCDILGIEAPID